MKPTKKDGIMIKPKKLLIQMEYRWSSLSVRVELIFRSTIAAIYYQFSVPISPIFFLIEEYPIIPFLMFFYSL